MLFRFAGAALFAAAVAAASSSPAFALEQTPVSPSPAASPGGKSPILASTLTVAAPLVMIVPALQRASLSDPTFFLACAAPLGLTTGYLYAGEPLRGLGVAAGGYAIPLASATLFHFLGQGAGS